MSRSDLHKKVADFVIPVHTVLRLSQSVDEALKAIREHKIEEKIFYFYVIDDDYRLKGVVSTRKLLLSHPSTLISVIMDDNIIAINSDQTLQESMELLSKYRLLALPVIDKEGRMLGIVDVQLYLEEAVDVAKSRRASTDIFQVLGVSLEEGKIRSPWQMYKKRMPWILCNMIGGISCAIVSGIFENVLTRFILLAFFIPLVLTLSESISMQSMTHSLQLLHRPRISFRRIFYRVVAEWKMVIMLAITSGILVGAISLLWRDGWHPAFSIATGIILSVTLSGTVGAAIPLILHARKLDPKVAAGPVVLMFADVITTTIYLGLSTLWLL